MDTVTFSRALGLFTTCGTLMSFSRSPHWAFRMWDFPRNALATLGLASVASYPWLSRGASRPEDVAFLGAVAASTALQVVKMLPWTHLHPKRVKKARRPAPEKMIRLLISNVEMANDQHEKWLQTVREHDPDVILALEVDHAWIAAVSGLEFTHRYSVRVPQQNCFGMALWSKLPLVDPQVKYLVQDDIPSIHTGVRLRDGSEIRLYGLHPRPPEPVRNQDSEPRDLELLGVGREIGAGTDPRPTIVAGDLNDVAWSRTTCRFLELSGLVDPRIGRGMYNSYNANNPLFRWPLDHVFHSKDFTLRSLRRLRNVGSDHFPMLIELCHESGISRGRILPLAVG